MRDVFNMETKMKPNVLEPLENKVKSVSISGLYRQ